MGRALRRIYSDTLQASPDNLQRLQATAIWVSRILYAKAWLVPGYDLFQQS
jgi:hypothetical protein